MQIAAEPLYNTPLVHWTLSLLPHYYRASTVNYGGEMTDMKLCLLKCTQLLQSDSDLLLCLRFVILIL